MSFRAPQNTPPWGCLVALLEGGVVARLRYGSRQVSRVRQCCIVLRGTDP